MIYEKLVQVHQKYQSARSFSHIPDSEWSEMLVKHEISPSHVEFDTTRQRLLFKPLNLYLDKQKHSFLLQSKTLNAVKAIYKMDNADVFLDDQDRIVIEIDQVKMSVENSQDIDVVYEVFILGVYNFVYDQPVVVLDIGMNVGIASLYFAHRSNVVGVWGYEPFKSTYQQAVENIQLNPQLSKKITSFDYGIDGEEKTITVEYDYNVKASVGVEGIDPKFQSKNATIIKEDMLLKSVNEIMDNVIKTYPDTEIVAKIDCEGSEYAIFEALTQGHQLEKIKIIMMEWHRKGPNILEKQLKEAGFIAFSRLPLSSNVGLIYAIRP
jgi:FkbM family methyltransferase